MKKTAQTASTQAFTQIEDIRDKIVLLRDNSACIIIRVTSVNFSLLSAQEQDSKVFAYAALLNSLSFPIQIVIVSRPVHIMPYLNSIQDLISKTPNPSLRTYMSRYKDFVTSLVQTTTVLDKQFFIVISYSALEGGVGSIVKTTNKSQSQQESFYQDAKTSLETKADSLLSQIHRLSLQAEVLKKEALIKLFYELYNQGEDFLSTASDIESPMVKGDR